MWIFYTFLVVTAVELVVIAIELLLDLLALLVLLAIGWLVWQGWQAVDRRGLLADLDKSTATSFPARNWVLLGFVVLAVAALSCWLVRSRPRVRHLHRSAEWAAEVRATPTVLELETGQQ